MLLRFVFCKKKIEWRVIFCTFLESASSRVYMKVFIPRNEESRELREGREMEVHQRKYYSLFNRMDEHINKWNLAVVNGYGNFSTVSAEMASLKLIESAATLGALDVFNEESTGLRARMKEIHIDAIENGMKALLAQLYVIPSKIEAKN